MEYQFKIGDSFKIKPEYQYIAPDQLGNVITIVDFETWGGRPAYLGSSGGIFCEHEIDIVQEAKKKKHTPIGRKYQKTIDTSGWNNDQFNSLHRGQWVKNFGATGQFLGITARGTTTINYKQTRDLKKQFAANKPLRQFVILHGGK